MIAKDAVECAFRFVEQQRRLISLFMEIYSPKDLERFRDVADGSFVLDGCEWFHVRHGAGVTFLNEEKGRINAHVAMSDYPRAIDAGRWFEYLESLGIATLSFDNNLYDVTPNGIRNLIDSLIERGILRLVVTRGRVLHTLFVFASESS